MSKIKDRLRVNILLVSSVKKYLNHTKGRLAPGGLSKHIRKL